MAYIEDPLSQYKHIPSQATPPGLGDMAPPADGGITPTVPPTTPSDEGIPPELPPSPPPPPMPMPTKGVPMTPAPSTSATPVAPGSFARPDVAAAIRPFRPTPQTMGGQNFGPGAPMVGGAAGGGPFSEDQNGNPTDDLMKRLAAVLGGK